MIKKVFRYHFVIAVTINNESLAINVRPTASMANKPAKKRKTEIKSNYKYAGISCSCSADVVLSIRSKGCCFFFYYFPRIRSAGQGQGVEIRVNVRLCKLSGSATFVLASFLSNCKLIFGILEGWNKPALFFSGAPFGVLDNIL